VVQASTFQGIVAIHVALHHQTHTIRRVEHVIGVVAVAIHDQGIPALVVTITTVA
jgi:hypothetical protein